MTYRIKRLGICSLEMWVAGVYLNGVFVRSTMCHGLAGAQAWVMSQGVKL